MILLLSEGEWTARDLSQTLSIPEKEVSSHLSHIARSVARQHKRLHVVPSSCLSCGYIFDTRKRFTRPGRCPRCKGERIRAPKYHIL
ncbi:MAG: transcriptional regulator [Thermodesulfobacteriota bacterium]|nr:transcriptional regulator [Thermodesulfobacteriota bacterium]